MRKTSSAEARGGCFWANWHASFPQNRGATYDEVRAIQVMGRIAVTPNGSFLSYEWHRVYSWMPNCRGVAFEVAPRKQTFMFSVDTPAVPHTCEQPSSQYQFYPAPGATYCLGELSPDAEKIAFYELDRDDKNVRTEVVSSVAGAAADGKLVFRVVDATELIKLLRDLVSLGKLFLLYKIIRQRPREQPEKRRSQIQ